jgi:hypothetical protein
MSGFSNFYTRLLNLFISSTSRVIPVATQEQEQVQVQTEVQAPAQRNYMFADETASGNIPSLNFVLTGLTLRGEIYIQDVHNYGTSVEERNTISANRRPPNIKYYYNPQTLSSAGRGTVSESSAGGGSVPRVSLEQGKQFYARQALEAANKARALNPPKKENDSKGLVNEVQKCEFECGICFDMINSTTSEDIVRVCHSGHVFHRRCPAYPDQKEDTSICPYCRSIYLFKFDPNQNGGFKSMIKYIKKQKQSRKPKNGSVNQTRKQRKQ